MNRKILLSAFVILLFSSFQTQTPPIVGFGDSNTSGVTGNPLGDPTNWLGMVSSENNLQHYGYGIGGSVMYGEGYAINSDPYQKSFSNRRQLANSFASGFATIFYGTNDEAQFVNDNWEEEYKKYIQESFIDKGFNKNRIILISLPYNPEFETTRPETYERYARISAYAKTVANELHIRFVDFYDYMKTHPNPNQYLLPDGIHLSASGHRLLADLVNEQLRMAPLPITFTYFKTKKLSEGSIQVDFKVDDISDVTQFEIEVSVDDQPFKVVKTLVPDKTEYSTVIKY